MSAEIHSRVLKRMTGLFDEKIIQNNLRGLYVETMVAEILGDRWHMASDDWAAWDIEHDDGTRVEVKQSAAKQTWAPPTNGATPAKFSIQKPKYIWRGAERSTASRRPADLYIFAWHPDVSDVADQRIVGQWQFFVVPTPMLPDQKSIGLNPLRRLATPVSANGLPREVDTLRIGGIAA